MYKPIFPVGLLTKGALCHCFAPLKEKSERSRSLLSEIRDQFQSWGIPVWQQKCEQALEVVKNLG